MARTVVVKVDEAVCWVRKKGKDSDCTGSSAVDGNVCKVCAKPRGGMERVK